MFKKILLLLLCLCLLLGGCNPSSSTMENTTTVNQEQQKIDASSSIQEKQSDTSQQNPMDAPGIHYPAIKETIIGEAYNPLASYLYSALHYNNSIYTSTLVFQAKKKSQLPLDEVLGNKLGDVFGNNDIYWSLDAKELAENNVKGMLYEAKNYDADFRVCIYEEKLLPNQKTEYCLRIFDKGNGITLQKGTELYRDRLHLEKSTTAYLQPEESFDIENPDVENIDAKAQKTALFMDGDLMQEFLMALFQGEFIDSNAEDGQQWTSFEAGGYDLVFADSNDITTCLTLYEEGYIAMSNQTEELFLLKMDKDICEKMIEKIKS